MAPFSGSRSGQRRVALTSALLLAIGIGGALGAASAGTEKIEPALQAEMNTLPSTTVRPVIVQYYQPVTTQVIRRRHFGSAHGARVQSLLGGVLNLVTGVVTGVLDLVNAVTASLSLSQVQQLANDPNVKYICEDRPLSANLDITGGATGAYAVQQGSVGGKSFTGNGVTVAVLDSGIAPHGDLKTTGLLPTSRIIAFADLVNGRR